jgi:hypothetical protein
MSAQVPYAGNPKNIDPGIRPREVTKSDSTELNARGLYIGTAGNLVITSLEGAVVPFKNVPAGTILPICAYKVMEATTAADIVALDVI